MNESWIQTLKKGSIDVKRGYRVYANGAIIIYIIRMVMHQFNVEKNVVDRGKSECFGKNSNKRVQKHSLFNEWTEINRK